MAIVIKTELDAVSIAAELRKVLPGLADAVMNGLHRSLISGVGADGNVLPIPRRMHDPAFANTLQGGSSFGAGVFSTRNTGTQGIDTGAMAAALAARDYSFISGAQAIVDPVNGPAAKSYIRDADGKRLTPSEYIWNYATYCKAHGVKFIGVSAETLVDIIRIVEEAVGSGTRR